ncbi:acyl-protein synthetase [Marinicrinis lubricantis]|uniref:Acyl-protein synthetase n=1 Tax=Marinicrinis lubricantis TaxID=2086470 RepID=A0ABW1IQT8_9BACL
MNIEALISQNPYKLRRLQKRKLLGELLCELTEFHQSRSEPYRKLLAAIPSRWETVQDIESLPMLPVRLFKQHELRSVPRESVIKTLTSSGTTSQVVSRIFLDKETSVLQTKALVSIMSSFVGNQRYPMIFVDSKDVIKDRTSFSARGAGLLGLSFLGRSHFYMLDGDMNIQWDALKQYLDDHKDENILFFGFTFMVWQYFYLQAAEQGIQLQLPGSMLIHSGGWKKLIDMAVDNQTFKDRLKDQLGIQKVHNFYGMVEQIGSVFVECEEGHLHAPDFADVMIRDPLTLEVLPAGQSGLIQTLSILPRSYPGHSLLTEDLGTILGEDDCPCGRHGKYFQVHGRLPAAELRGCSDTHAFEEVSRT